MIKELLKKIILSILIFIILFNFGLTSVTFAAPEAETSAEVQEVEERYNSLLDVAMEGIAGILFSVPRLIFVTLAGVVNVGTYAIASSGMAEGTLTSTFVTPFDIIFNQFALTDINIFSLDGLNSEGFIYQVRTNIAMWHTIVFAFSIILLILVFLMLLCVLVLRKDIATDKAKVSKAFGMLGVSFLITGMSSAISYAVVYFNGVLVKILKGVVSVDLSTSMLALQEATFSSTSHILGTGATVVYVLLTFQTLIFLCKYIFRFLKVSLLVIISPLVPVPYSICKMVDSGSDTAIRNWLMELIFTVCDQLIHCIVYTFVVGVALKAFAGATEISGIEALAPAVVAIIAIFFVGSAERLIRGIFRIRKAAGIVQVASDFVKGSAQALVYVQGMANVIRGGNPETASDFGNDQSSKSQNAGTGDHIPENPIKYKSNGNQDGSQNDSHVTEDGGIVVVEDRENEDKNDNKPDIDADVAAALDRLTDAMNRLGGIDEKTANPNNLNGDETLVGAETSASAEGELITKENNSQPLVINKMSSEQYQTLMAELTEHVNTSIENAMKQGNGYPNLEDAIKTKLEELAREITEKIGACKTQDELDNTIRGLEASEEDGSIYKDFVTSCINMTQAGNFIEIEEADVDGSDINDAVSAKAETINEKVNKELVEAIIKALDSSPEFKEVARQIASKAVAFSAEIDGEVNLNTQQIAEYITRMSASSEHEGSDNAGEAMEELKKQVSAEGSKKIDEFNKAISEGDIKKAREIRSKMDDATKALVEMEAIAESYGFTTRIVDKGAVTETTGVREEMIGVTRTPTQSVIDDLNKRKNDSSSQE